MNKFIISESEKQRILNMHKSSSSRHYLSEATMAPEPVFDSEPLEFGLLFPEGGSKLPNSGKDEVVTYLKNKLKSSLPTIIKFIDSGTLPKFITISVGTSSTGSPEINRKVAQERINAGIDMIELAFTELGKETGEVVSQEYIQKFLTTNTNYSYEPTKLAKIFDKTNSKSKPSERFLVFKISPIKTMGKEWKQISGMADEIEGAITHWGVNYVNVEEEGIANAICKCETYSDIEDLDTELQRHGGLQYVINKAITDGLTAMGSDTKERIKIAGCLNKASNKSGKGDVADIAGDKLTITGI
jgi:hypothetical protein